MQLSAQEVKAALPWQDLVEALRDIFTRKVTSPVRHHHVLNVPQEKDAMLLLMPAWLEGEYCGVKQVFVFPSNNDKGLPGLTSNYLLSSGKTGANLAQLEGNELTSRRTAAASALASSYLSRQDASRLLMVGSGRMARNLIAAHRSVRSITHVSVYNRNLAGAEKLVEDLIEAGITAKVCRPDELAQEAANADIISCATMSKEPIIKGDWLNPGCHLDLVGGFTPEMQEADNAALKKAKVFVDTRAGALSEAGDIIIPLKAGVIQKEDIQAEFTELCSNAHKGRNAYPDAEKIITVFKSVGDSREDLAAAILAYQSLSK
ncbi:ornithine cyclodeaminase [Marinomonas sp. S3726]|uniref:ornithine cyclodeaminase family protein n=1 Tax=Marinomonas sp. S3726 TaxID=579484 RepID=UPI0005F9BE1D|nr:ornithine cyclodeaminase family protein [Marinomonas sp. S3726]KJZ15414.1 ornithine cyclodeaminase [Marinomonas sp. S3726]